MKLAYVLTTYPCRTETFASREIEHLRRLGFDIKVLAAVDPEMSIKKVQSQCVRYRPALFSRTSVSAVIYLLYKYPAGIFRLFALVSQLIVRYPTEAKQLLVNLHTIGYFTRYLDRENIHHIHAYFLNWPANIALALSRITGRTFSISGHARDIFVESGSLKMKADFAQFITICTRQGLDYLKDNLPARLHHKLHLVYHGVNAADIKPYESWDITEQKLEDIIIVAARFVPKKGLVNLLQAFFLVRKSRPACILMVAGDGPQRDELERLTCRLSIADAVWFIGWQEQDFLMRYLQAATVLAVPSVIAADGDRDGIPNVILEAFAGRVPVVASNVGGIGEAVQDKKTGILVEPGDVKQLADTLLNVLRDKRLQKKLSQKAYASVIKNFNIEHNIKTLADLLRNTH